MGTSAGGSWKRRKAAGWGEGGDAANARQAARRNGNVKTGKTTKSDEIVLAAVKQFYCAASITVAYPSASVFNHPPRLLALWRYPSFPQMAAAVSQWSRRVPTSPNRTMTSPLPRASAATPRLSPVRFRRGTLAAFCTLASLAFVSTLSAQTAAQPPADDDDQNDD